MNMMSCIMKFCLGNWETVTEIFENGYQKKKNFIRLTKSVSIEWKIFRVLFAYERKKIYNRCCIIMQSLGFFCGE